MASLCYSGGSSWIAALTLMVLRPSLSWARDIPLHFMTQGKCECRFSNGTEQVRYLASYIYNQDLLVVFDSEVGEFMAVTELGRSDAEYWNQQKDFIQQLRTAVDRFCRHNYRIFESFLVQRRVEPKVTVFPAKIQPFGHHSLLVCSVNGFYPGQIEVRWFRNGQEQEDGVISSGLIRNGDLTFQILVMLETVVQSGDIYICHMEHPSLKSPIKVDWRTHSEFAQNKMLCGICGFVLGLLFLGVGLFISFRHQKEFLN